MLQNLFGAINFIDWFSFLNIDITAQGVTMPLSEWVAQYACVQTNYVMTIAGLIAIGILLLKRIKKWWWYAFFAILTIVSITSVGMHTANYGEFQSGVLTTKLVGSYVDMSFTILTAWAGVCCFIFEFCDKRFKKPFAIGISGWTAVVILTLTIEVFIFKDRPLFILGGGAAMDGAKGGFSVAEICCFLTALPVVPITIINAKKIDRTEVGLVGFVISIFVVGFLVSNLYGDNQINSLLLGNIHTHSIWHILNGLGALTVVFWIDYRTLKQIAEGSIPQPKGKRSFKVVITESHSKKIKPQLSEQELLYKNQKKETNNWGIIIGFLALYIILSLTATAAGAIKGARGDYAQYDYSEFQFLITAAIIFVGLALLSIYPIIQLKKSVERIKNTKCI